MDFPGLERQQQMLQTSLLGSFAASIISGCAYHSVRIGWYTYLFGLFITFLINVVDWDYFLCEPTDWSEGKYLDTTGYLSLEARDRQLAKERAPKQRARITMSGGPVKMTIRSKVAPQRIYKKWNAILLTNPATYFVWQQQHWRTTSISFAKCLSTLSNHS